MSLCVYYFLPCVWHSIGPILWYDDYLSITILNGFDLFWLAQNEKKEKILFSDGRHRRQTNYALSVSASTATKPFMFFVPFANKQTRIFATEGASSKTLQSLLCCRVDVVLLVCVRLSFDIRPSVFEPERGIRTSSHGHRKVIPRSAVN